MKRLLRKRLSKMALLAFATSLFIVPAASAMPMLSDPAAASSTGVAAFHVDLAQGNGGYTIPNLNRPSLFINGQYSAATRSTLLGHAQGKGGYTMPTPAGAGPSVTPTDSNSFPYRNAGIAFALALVLTAVCAAGVVRVLRRDRHIPVLQ